MNRVPIDFEQTMMQARKLPLRLEISALGEALLVSQGIETQQVALRLIEIAGWGARGFDQQGLGPIELIAGLGDRWRARHADTALRALATGWTKLSTHDRRLALGLGRRRWIAIVKELSADPDPAIRTNALQIAMDTSDPGFGVMVCSMLGDEHQKVRLAADRALLGLVLGMFKHLEPDMLGEDYVKIRDRATTPMLGDPKVLELERCSMLVAIADAAWSFATHRCRSPLLASLLLMDRQGATKIERKAFEKMRRLLSERNHPSHMPMRTVLRTTPAQILRERALRWLVVDPIAGVAASRLDVAESIAEHRAVLEHMHLSVRPRRMRALRKVRIGARQDKGSIALEASAPIIDTQTYETLGIDARRGYIRWVVGLDLDASVRRTLLERVMADRDPRVRLHGCCVSDALDLVDYLYDPDESVARHAGTRWSSIGTPAPSMGTASWERRVQTARLNERSGNPWIRRIAREEIERLTIDQPESPASRLAARRLFHSDPAKFVRSMRELMIDPDRRLSALGMIIALGLEQRFEMDLVSMSHVNELDSKVRATLVRALSNVKSVAAGEAVLRCLESDDQRVVANAIESEHTPIDALVEYKDDAHHRVRASAIRRMLVQSGDGNVVDAAVEDLLKMLRDERVGHRLAGVWAAQRILEVKASSKHGSRFPGGSSWRTLITTLDSMCRDEQDEGVRRRADQCVHRLLVSQRVREREAVVV